MWKDKFLKAQAEPKSWAVTHPGYQRVELSPIPLQKLLCFFLKWKPAETSAIKLVFDKALIALSNTSFDKSTWQAAKRQSSICASLTSRSWVVLVPLYPCSRQMVSAVSSGYLALCAEGDKAGSSSSSGEGGMMSRSSSSMSAPAHGQGASSRLGELLPARCGSWPWPPSAAREVHWYCWATLHTQPATNRGERSAARFQNTCLIQLLICKG